MRNRSYWNFYDTIKLPESLFNNNHSRAAEIIGNGSEKYAPHVKGLELPAYHPAHITGASLGYAVSGRGGYFSNIYTPLEYTWSGERAAPARKLQKNAPIVLRGNGMEFPGQPTGDKLRQLDIAQAFSAVDAA